MLDTSEPKVKDTPSVARQVFKSNSIRQSNQRSYHEPPLLGGNGDRHYRRLTACLRYAKLRPGSSTPRRVNTPA
jgi:hypothetical protein